MRVPPGVSAQDFADAIGQFEDAVGKDWVFTSDAVMDTYSFNDHALLRFHETLKDALDPNGILSAGRYGIWPRLLREERS